jgi:hypothetical protein
MAENKERTDAATHSDVTTKVGVFIQNINNRVMEIYDDLQKMTNVTKDASLAVLKSTKVRPRALVRTLEGFMSDCKCSDLKTGVQGVIYSVEDMMPGGETRLFVCHSKKGLKTELEFVCGAVRMYKYDNENVCDFCVSTYSYAKSIDKGALAAGVGVMTSGVAFGALAGLGIVTGGVAPIILGSAAAAVGILSITGGVAVTTAALDTELEANIKDILEASFLKELVSRGHAVLQDGRLFLTHDEGYQADE